MKDEIVIASSEQESIRIYAACTTQLVEQARVHHNCYPTSSAALGRVCSMAAVLASMLKNEEERIIVTVNGHGPAGTVLAEAKGNGNVRGFIGDPQVYMVNPKNKKLDVGGAIGTQGTLSVSKDLRLKEMFTGTVPLVSGEIGDDFAYYFAQSEQTPSVVAVGVLVQPDLSIQAAGALLIQCLPDASEEVIRKVELVSKQLKPVSGLIAKGLTPEEIITSIFPDAHILKHSNVQWQCDCSKEKFLAALATLKEADIQEMIDEDHGAQVTCQYCAKQYSYTQKELEELLKQRTCGK